MPVLPPPPPLIAGLPVVCYTAIDGRHRATGATRHVVGGVLRGPAAALAVCRDSGGFYLFYCDAAWEAVTDTWHATLQDALDQAEFEYAGTSATWQRAGG